MLLFWFQTADLTYFRKYALLIGLDGQVVKTRHPVQASNVDKRHILLSELTALICHGRQK